MPARAESAPKTERRKWIPDVGVGLPIGQKEALGFELERLRVHSLLNVRWMRK